MAIWPAVMLRRRRARLEGLPSVELPSGATAEDVQLEALHPEQWREGGQRMGLRNLTHRTTTTQWRGD